jgi:hypothetical protein
VRRQHNDAVLLELSDEGPHVPSVDGVHASRRLLHIHQAEDQYSRRETDNDDVVVAIVTYIQENDVRVADACEGDAEAPPHAATERRHG